MLIAVILLLHDFPFDFVPSKCWLGMHVCVCVAGLVSYFITSLEHRAQPDWCHNWCIVFSSSSCTENCSYHKFMASTSHFFGFFSFSFPRMLNVEDTIFQFSLTHTHSKEQEARSKDCSGEKHNNRV